MPRQNFAKMVRIRAENIAKTYKMSLDFEQGSRANGIAWKVGFTYPTAFVGWSAVLRQDLRAGTARELFDQVAAFGDGLYAAYQMLGHKQP